MPSRRPRNIPGILRGCGETDDRNVSVGIVLLLILFSNSAVKTKKNVSACLKNYQGEVAGYRRRGFIYENQNKTKVKLKVISKILY
jgi:hypothetical protein